MVWRVWVAAAIGLWTVACTAQEGPPLAVSAPDYGVAAPVERVQYWGGYDYGESYRPTRPRGYGYSPYGYDGSPRRGYGYGYGGSRSYYESRRYEPRYNDDREAAKDYVKSYRRAQKEQFKAQVRGWNRAHGF